MKNVYNVRLKSNGDLVRVEGMNIVATAEINEPHILADDEVEINIDTENENSAIDIAHEHRRRLLLNGTLRIQIQ